MPGNRQVSLIAFVACAIVAVTLAVQACPYCPPTDPPLSQKLAESDSACVVKFLDSKNGEELSMQTTTFQVVKNLPVKDELIVGSKITTPYGVTAEPGDHFLLMGQIKVGSMEWNLPIALDDLGSEHNYILKAPALERPPVERLAYFLKYLDSQNSTISNDAFGEFARARFEDVEQLAPQLSREKVRSWVEDPNPQLDVRRAFYGMLLGLCGNDDDAVYLEQKILAPIDPDKNRLGIEGLMGGYLLLRGQAGLSTLIKKELDSLPSKLSGDDPRIVDLNAMRTTLSFLWDFRRSQFTERSLRAAMRRFLDWPEFAEQAIIDLARWKDWTPLDRLIAAYGQEPWETRSAKEKIVAYMLSCRKDVPKTAGNELPAHAIKAQKFLDSLDPEFVQSVKQMTSGPLSVPRTTAKAKSRDESSE